jgi:hypothetical protein
MPPGHGVGSCHAHHGVGSPHSAVVQGLEVFRGDVGSLYQPSSVMLPGTLIEFVYPKGFLTRRVNNSGDISWHKDRVFISEVFRFEDLGFELVAEDFYKVFSRDIEIGEFDVEALRFRPVQVLR